jgi:hypothetical protein
LKTAVNIKTTSVGELAQAISICTTAASILDMQNDPYYGSILLHLNDLLMHFREGGEMFNAIGCIFIYFSSCNLYDRRVHLPRQILESLRIAENGMEVPMWFTYYSHPIVPVLILS